MVAQVNVVLLIPLFCMRDQVRHSYLEPVMIIGSFVVFDKYNYEMTECVFHLLTLYSLSRLGFPFAL